MTVAEPVKAPHGMDQSLPVTAPCGYGNVRDARVRIESVHAKSSYGTYSLPPDAQHAEGWRGDLSVVVIS